MANRFYKPPIHHREWARNGMVPHTQFPRLALTSLNHVYAFRRKTFLVFGGPALVASSALTAHRVRCRTGHAATHITFIIGACGDSTTLQSQITVSLTKVGGATQTRTVSPSTASVLLPDAPSNVSYFNIPLPVDADSEYEMSISIDNHGILLSGCVYEQATDETLPYFSALQPGALHPITDQLREDLLVGLSNAWKRNGSHLVSWTVQSATIAFQNATTTWTNVLDDTTTAPGATTLGFYLQDLQPWCRLSEPNTLRCTFAAYASCAGGSTGEVRLQDSSGTRCSLTGIGSTAQWYTSNVAIDITSMSKVDLQARVAAAGSTITLEAVSMYTYVA